MYHLLKQCTMIRLTRQVRWPNLNKKVSDKLGTVQSLDIQYCGITEGSFYNRLKNHGKAPLVTRDQELWLANVEYPEEATRTFLEKAESIIIYFWQPNLNDRKKVSPPTPITLVNKWYKKDGSPRLRQHPIMKDLADVLCWDGEIWRTGNLSVYGN